jgi:hypothetical protein
MGRPGWLVIACVVGAALAPLPAQAAEPAASARDQRLAASLNKLDELDAQLLQAQQALDAARSWRERRRLTGRLRALTQAREQALDELDALLGGTRLPSDQRPTAPLEEQLDRRERNQEVILERNVDGGLSTD